MSQNIMNILKMKNYANKKKDELFRLNNLEELSVIKSNKDCIY